MNEIVFFGSAFLAGLLSFLSPCVFPLIPSYLSFISGTTLKELETEGSARKKAFINTVLFIAGFSLIFIILQVIAIATFGVIQKITDIMNLIAGILIIILGLNFIFDFIKILNMEKRFNIGKMQKGFIGPLIFGIAFGAGWTPCIGPFLFTILMTAGATGNYITGIILMIFYSLGLGLPFLIIGLFFSILHKKLNKIKPHMEKIKILSGIFLILVGIFIILGGLSNFNIILFQAASNLKSAEINNPFLVKVITSGVFFILCILVTVFYIIKIKNDENSSVIKPVRIIFMLVFFIFFILTVTDFIKISEIFSSWIELNI
jgi:cytochrome c-type biogenesis protein